MLPPDWEGDSAARPRSGREWCYPQTRRMIVLPSKMEENGSAARRPERWYRGASDMG